MKLLTTVFICLLVATSSALSDQSVAVQKTAQMFVAAFNSNDPVRIEREFNSDMRAAITSEQFAQFLSGTASRYGRILKLHSPQVTDTTGTFRVTFERGTLDMLLSLDSDGKIGGLLLRPSKPSPRGKSPQPALRNKIKLGLPFKGAWHVFWGGDTPKQNYHQNAPNQRFAFDFIKVDEKGSSHRGRGTKNEDYYAFGQELMAPAAGIVTDVVDGIRDNAPGKMNKMFVPGNIVVIKHPTGEYSLFAHLKLNSSRVKVGDRVTKGQVIGLCGNSGNSSEPHLHYQLQKSPFFSDEGSIKVFFSNIIVRHAGKRRSEVIYSPVKGDLVSSG